jgi:hypothetical protein
VIVESPEFIHGEYVKDMFLFILGFLGGIGSLVLLIINIIKKKPKKKVLIALAVCFVLFAAGVAMTPTEPSADSKAKETTEKKEMAKGEVAKEKTTKEETANTKNKEDKQDISAESKKEEVEVIAIAAGELYAAYEKNEVSADQMYKGKILAVEGTIENIGKDIIDSIYITLETGDFLSNVQCYFKKEDADIVANLSKGQNVTVVGKCTGLSLGSVMIKDSKIQ